MKLKVLNRLIEDGGLLSRFMKIVLNKLRLQSFWKVRINDKKLLKLNFGDTPLNFLMFWEKFGTEINNFSCKHADRAAVCDKVGERRYEIFISVGVNRGCLVIEVHRTKIISMEFQFFLKNFN